MTEPGGPPDGDGRVELNVSSIGGYAYGTVGADIHVFGDGAPVYLLENWRPAPDADALWLREAPSRMLNGRFALVDFTGRDDELARLGEWRDSRPRLAVHWLHGPGGVGKSRLAAQFAHESEAAGWRVAVAQHGSGSVIPPPGSQDLTTRDKAGVLLIVDYADRWPLGNLTWLLSNSLLHQVGTPARVLLIARGTNGWPAVRAALAPFQATVSQQKLDELTTDEDRAQMYSVAYRGFALLYEQDGPADVERTAVLAESEMGLVLAIHMAALVAVDAMARDVGVPQDMAGLTVYLLDREHLHWTNLYGDPTHDLTPGGRAFRLPPEAMNQVVYTAALTGPVVTTKGS